MLIEQKVKLVNYGISVLQGRVVEQTIDIPHSMHASLQSGKGA